LKNTYEHGKLPQVFKAGIRVRLAGILALATGALLYTTSALAVGISEPSSSPIFERPLNIEIPLIVSSGEAPPKSECVRVVSHIEPTDRDYFPRGAQATVVTENRLSKVLLKSVQSVKTPVVEFRLEIGCDAKLVRDFVLLTALPEKQMSAPTATAAATLSVPTASVPEKTVVTQATRPSQPSQPSQSTHPTTKNIGAVSSPTSSPISTLTSTQTPTTSATDKLQLEASTNLNAIARQLYPEDRETRDAYRQAMAAANPSLFGDSKRVGSVPLPAGTVLNIPSELPKPGEISIKAPKLAKTSVAAPETVKFPTEKTKSPRRGKTDARTVNKGPDRLMIGREPPAEAPLLNSTSNTAKPLTPQELASAVDRMKTMLEEQGQVGAGIADNLQQLDGTFTGIKNNVQAFEGRIAQIEAERKAEKLKPEPKLGLGLLELLVVILAFGAMGAGITVLHHRLQMQRFSIEQTLAQRMHHPSGEFGEFSTFGTTSGSIDTKINHPNAPTSEQTPKDNGTETDFDPTIVDSIDFTKTVVLERPVSIPSATTAEAANKPKPGPAKPMLVSEPSPSVQPLPYEAIHYDTHHHDDQPPVRTAEITDLKPAPQALKISPQAAEERARQTLELADIMMSMGLTQAAAAELVGQIRSNPRQELSHWLKLLEIYQKAGMQKEFEQSSQELRQNLNVQAHDWNTIPARSVYKSLADYPHILAKIQGLWLKPGCEEYLDELLYENREGKRAGFPQSVAEEILLLKSMVKMEMNVETEGLTVEAPKGTNVKAAGERSFDWDGIRKV